MYGSGIAALFLWLACPVFGVRLALHVPMLLQFLMGMFPPLGVVVGQGEVFSGKLFYGVRTVGGIEGFYAAGGLGADGIHWREAARASSRFCPHALYLKPFGASISTIVAIMSRCWAPSAFLPPRPASSTGPAGEYYRAPPRLPHRSYSPLRAGRGGVVARDYYEGVRVFFQNCARKSADFPVRIPHMV